MKDSGMGVKTGGVSAQTSAAIDLVEAHSARNYAPLPVVIAEGDGAWVYDVDGRRYLDMLAAYGALNFGHRHPQLTAVAHAQLDRLTLTSRAFHNDQLGTFCAALAELAGMDLVLPMNTGAEAVETALKTARKWGYQVKGIPADQAKIVIAGGNFHGRTITIVSFSDDKESTADFGPFTPGFVSVPYGDADALRAAIDDWTAAVLIEPIQGEGGVIIPPDGYLRAVRDVCTEANVLMIADEIQSGLGRTGYTFACDHEGVRPDVYVLGKALGGGMVPLSAVVSRRDVLGVFRPGEHGSTFGGNPLACAIGIEVVRMISTGEYQEHAAALGERLAEMLQALPGEAVTAVRSRGLWAGIDLANRIGREVCEGLLRRGILAKDAHEHTIRLAPPLVIEVTDLEWALGQLAEELAADES
ncbi:MAG TPA: ornithine--oxo-acid transaminase [Jatrophihabitantaceae bacterium]|nr:ornithine--oxo-acid transaminase [Jatrophihabitantaceae bacterium]